MARGVMVLLFAYILTFTARVSSFEADLDVGMQHPAMAPAYAPGKPHRYAPAPAPAYGLEKPHLYAPVKAPSYPPTKPIAPTPEVEAPKRGCGGLCVDYCDTKPGKKRVCQRVCTACCAKCDCVPEQGVTCENWDFIIYHNQKVSCP